MNKPWIQLFNGGKFNITQPSPEDFKIGVVAHSLSRQFRYAGHTKRGFDYTVAQHCVLGSMMYPPFLYHDVVEVITTDIPGPVKKCFPEIEKLAWKIRIAGYLAFGYNPEEVDWERINQIDHAMLATEYRDLMEHTHDWSEFLAEEPYPDPINIWTPDQAEVMFLGRHDDIQCNMQYMKRLRKEGALRYAQETC